MTWTHRLASCPWPERVGLRCQFAVNPGDGIYPFNKPHKKSAVILIENDPLDDDGVERGWSCVVDPADLESLAEGEA